MKICPLCEINEADNENSHIIPKFLGKPLFEKSKPRHSLQINRNGKILKTQDTPKEDHLICSSCEKRFEVLETYFARKLISINDYNNRKEKFKIYEISPNKVLECLDLNSSIFKLFYYSILWRISVCTHPMFTNFKLSNFVETTIRSFLDKNLFDSHKELLRNIDNIINSPDFEFIAYKPQAGKREFKGIFTAFQMSDDCYSIFTSDIIFYFYTKEDNLRNIPKHLLNSGNQNIKFVLADSLQWSKLSDAVIRHRLFRKNDI